MSEGRRLPVVRGRILVVRVNDPPTCRSEGTRKKAYPADWQNPSGHDFVWRQVDSVDFPGTISSFGVCKRCWRVAGTNMVLKKVTAPNAQGGARRAQGEGV